MGIADGPPADIGPPTVRAARRSLVVLAGLPGAGKTTLLEKLDATAETSVLDSEQVRARLRAVLPRRLPYRWYRPVVHIAHRARIGGQCALVPRPVVAHEPCTRPTTRAMLVLFGWVTRRQRIVVWLHVDPDEALAGQHSRGRLIRSRSFHRHVRRAERVYQRLRAGRTLRGWDSVLLFHRADLARGLRVHIAE